VHALIPNVAVLSQHLTTFAEACSATEVILFERTTFLVIATSTILPPTAITSSSGSSSYALSMEGNPDDPYGDVLDPTRYERTSELIKAFKHSCARVREEFRSLELEFPDCTAVLDELTKNMYVLVIVHDPTIGEFVPALKCCVWMLTRLSHAVQKRQR
jgi:Ras-related GTP-binding protein A/B